MSKDSNSMNNVKTNGMQSNTPLMRLRAVEVMVVIVG